MITCVSVKYGVESGPKYIIF